MTVSLRQVLALDLVRRARPRIVHGEHLLERPVRWVHTSELVEAASLLRGGELLLTTGQGLAGRGPVAQRSYVTELAARGAAGLMLELGWTFPQVPDELEAAARAHQLPLVALERVVPFVEMTEEIQAQLLHAETGWLRRERRVREELTGQLLTGEGLGSVVARAAALGDCSMVLVDEEGSVVAAGGGGRPGVGEGERCLQDVRVLGQDWGQLHAFCAPDVDRTMVRCVLEVAAQVVALALMSGPGPALRSPRARLRQELLSDLFHDRFRATADREAAAAGLVLPLDGELSVFAVEPASSADLPALVGACEAAGDGGGLAGEVDGIVLAVVPVTGADSVMAGAAAGLTGAAGRAGPALAERLLAFVDEFVRRRGAGRPARLALAEPVRALDGAGRQLRHARDTLAVATTLRLRQRAVVGLDLLTDRLLLPAVDAPVAVELVDDLLRPLVEHDQRHGGDLVRTLSVYLTNGTAKAATADELHIRRQTLYKRLTRIQALVGDLTDPAWRVSLLMALRIDQLLRARSDR